MTTKPNTTKPNDEEKPLDWYLDLETLAQDLKMNISDLYHMKEFDQAIPLEVEKTLGRYKVKYTNYNHYPYILYRPFGYHGSKANNPLRAEESEPRMISFYEDDLLIKELPQTFANPCLILGGDGQTRKGTKFTLLCGTGGYNDYYVEVRNFEFELIRETLGGICLESLFETDDDYFLTVADQPVNDPHEDPHLGIVVKSSFFDDDGTQPRTSPYDSYRIGLPTNGYSSELFPVKVSRTKMILNDGQELDYSEVSDFDFDPSNKQSEMMNSMFAMMGFPQMANLSSNPEIEQALIDHGQVCIKFPEVSPETETKTETGPGTEAVE